MFNDCFVHLFAVPTGKYCYDVNTNEIIELTDDAYFYLCNDLKQVRNENDAKCFLEGLQHKGYLKKQRVQECFNPYLDFIEYYLKNKINYLVLQVTQNCNLRCEYCIYSGNYKTRSHTNKRLSIETAKSAIDYLIKHSNDCAEIKLGFYGGEPLLEFNLIKKCVEYIEKEGFGKEISYYITTNGTLLDEEIMDFFYEKSFNITISLDGPEEVHNLSRHFQDSGKGSYAIIIDNMSKLKGKYPDYYKNHVMFNAVMTSEQGFDAIEEYYSEYDIVKNNVVSSGLVSDTYAEEKYIIAERYLVEERYKEFLMFLAKLDKIEYKRSNIMDNEFQALADFYEELIKNKRRELPKRWHHGGPCMPGIKRLFMSVDGHFYPCEKVSESQNYNNIGNVDKGIDVQKVKEMLNFGIINHIICQNCWAYSMCGICIQNVDNMDVPNSTEKRLICRSLKKQIEERMINYVILERLGYNWEK